MTVDDAIVYAVEAIVPEIAPQVYTGSSLEYCVYNHSDFPKLFAAGKPKAIVSSVQLHYCLPTGENPRRKLINLCNSLCNAGFTYPEIIDISDADGQHYVLECQYREAAEYGQDNAVGS